MAGAEDEQEGAALPRAGWYPDPRQEGRERLWDGERWRESFRPRLADREEPTPAGWYPDPDDSTQLRLWSGERWMEARRPVGAPFERGAARDPSGQVAGKRYIDANPPQPLTVLGRFVMVALGLTILPDIAVLITSHSYIGYLNERLDEKPLYLGSVEGAVTDLHTARYVYAGMFLVAAILFGIWFFRAYRNLVRAGIRDLRFGPGWAVGGWLIPFFSWVRPKSIANDIWRGSEALSDRRLEGWRERSVSALIHWWWACWLAGTIIGFAGRTAGAEDGEAFFTLSAKTLRDERTSLYIGQVGILFMIAAAVLAIVAVWRLSEMQDDALLGADLSDPLGPQSEAEAA